MSSKKKRTQLLAVLLVLVVALIMGVAAPQVWADDEPDCYFNIELNATDEDAGVRGFFDYEPWDSLTIEDPDDKEIADVLASNSLEDQGFAEWGFETGEPKLWDDGYTFSVFLERFPESDEEKFYLFTATPIDDGELETVECEAEFTHVIPCAPEINIKVHGKSKVTISWDEVTEVVDTEASDNGQSIVCVDPETLGLELEIEEYLVIVEGEDNDTELQINVSSDVTKVVIPQRLLGEGSAYEVEVLAVEESGNQTITEEEFELK